MINKHIEVLEKMKKKGGLLPLDRERNNALQYFIELGKRVELGFEIDKHIKHGTTICLKCDGNGTTKGGFKKSMPVRVLCGDCDGKGIIIDTKYIQSYIKGGKS